MGRPARRERRFRAGPAVHQAMVTRDTRAEAAGPATYLAAGGSAARGPSPDRPGAGRPGPSSGPPGDRGPWRSAEPTRPHNRPRGRALLAAAPGLVAGVVLLVVVVAVGSETLPRWLPLVGVALLVGGFVALVSRLHRSSPDEDDHDPDDGAVV